MLCSNQIIILEWGGWMSYLVANMQKLKADNLVGLGNHDQRRTRHHKNTDIDVNRSALNYDFDTHDAEGLPKNPDASVFVLNIFEKLFI